MAFCCELLPQSAPSEIYHFILPENRILNQLEVFFKIITNSFSYSCKAIWALVILMHHYLHITNFPAPLPWYFNTSIFLVHKIRRTTTKFITIQLSFHKKVVSGNNSSCNEAVWATNGLWKTLNLLTRITKVFSITLLGLNKRWLNMISHRFSPLLLGYCRIICGFKGKASSATRVIGIFYFHTINWFWLWKV